MGFAYSQPMTWLNNNFDENKSVADFIRRLGETGLSVIGLTNYFCLAKNEVEIICYEISKNKLGITVLPNIELRVAQANKKRRVDKYTSSFFREDVYTKNY